jgi:G3E family GTPase
MDPEFLNIDQEHVHDQSVSSCGAVITEPISLGKLERWIGELIQTKATDLYRYKGVINVIGMDAPYVFQGVHMLFTGNFIKSGWEDTKIRQTHFCFIGKNIDK